MKLQQVPLTPADVPHEPQAVEVQKAVNADRISWVDHARGIAIMLIVYRHVVVGMKRSGVFVSTWMYDVQEIFYNFRMPVFFILSGIFVANSLRKRTRMAVLKDRGATVLYPYFVWGVAMMVLQIMFSQYANAQRSWSDLWDIIIQPRGVDHLWYLFALFNVTALYLLLSNFIKNPWVHFALAALLHTATFADFLQGNSLISDMFYFYPYFLIGTVLSPVLLNKEKREALLRFNNLTWVLPLIIVGQWFWFIHRDQESTYFPLFFLINLVACYFVYIISFKISQKSSNDWLSYIGKRSLYIYILHVPVAAVIRNVVLHLAPDINAWLLLLIGWTGGLLVPMVLYNTLKRVGFGKLFSLKG